MATLQTTKATDRSLTAAVAAQTALYKPTPQNPLVIAVTNLKGGVAKTTTAVHFAEYLRQFGETVLVDSDPNRSAIAWAGRTEKADSFRVINEIQLARYAGQACAYVIDTKARPDADDLKALIDTATLIVLPTTTSGDDLRVTAQTAQLLAQVGSQIHRALITKTPTQAGSTEVLEAKKFFAAEGVPVFKHWVRQYKAYQYAFLEGVPVCHVKNAKSQDAWSDYRAVMQEVVYGH